MVAVLPNRAHFSKLAKLAIFVWLCLAIANIGLVKSKSICIQATA